MFKVGENKANNLNTSGTWSVQDQANNLQAEIEERNKAIKYFQNYIAKHQPSTSTMIMDDTTSNHSNMVTIPIPRLLIVSSNLLKFGDSWDSNDFNLVKDPEEFVDRFEWILRTYEINLDTSWQRLLPLSLGSSEANWVEQNLIFTQQATTWLQAKESLLSHYQNPHWWAALIKELWMTQLKKNETIRNYCDRYCKLMWDCRIEDDHEGIVSKFIDSLPVIFQDKILMVKVANPL